MRRRHKARRWVLQILYAWDLRNGDGDLREEARRFFERRHIAPETRGYAERVIDAIARSLGEIDDLIDEGTEGWGRERLAVVDRNVLRIALAEFLHLDDVPWKVSIDEAVQLAGRYGGTDSPRFVNGVLDALARKLHLVPS